MKKCKFCGNDISKLTKSRLYCNNRCKRSYYRDIKNPHRRKYNSISNKSYEHKCFKNAFSSDEDE